MKKQLLTALALAGLFAACKKDDTTDNSNNNNNNNTTTTSVKAGTKFTYQRTDYDSVTGTAVLSTTQYTLTMLRDSTINNEKWFVAERKDAAKTEYGLIKINANGLYGYNSSGGAMNMKFKAAVNDTWVDANGETCKVISINQTVTVPAGSYTNATYIETHDSNDPGIENKTWYNEKEILLKNEEYDDGGTILDYRDELVSVQF